MNYSMHKLSHSPPLSEAESSFLILPIRWLFVHVVPPTYITYKPSFVLLITYLLRVGFFNLVLKALSRYSERSRNKKIFGVGLALKFSSINSSLVETCLFYSPCANNESFLFCHESHIYPLGFLDVRRFTPGSFNVSSEDFYSFCDLVYYSGRNLYNECLVGKLSLLRSELLESYPDIFSAKPISISPHEFFAVNSLPRLPSYISVSRPALPNLEAKNSAVLFGLGNYAKTIVIPNITSSLSLQRIHEIDPAQIPPYLASRYQVSTSPVPIDDLFFSAWFIAGFHHTHLDLALQSLRAGSYAVIEKPLSSSEEDIFYFRKSIDPSFSKFFLCFHKRYSPFNALILQDLGCSTGDPINMHSIVYEVFLPQFHWYNWPSSGSRIVSNGCHWIDWFMHLNSYSPVSSYDLSFFSERVVNIFIELENSAVLTLVLTDVGSPRFGVREHVEFRNSSSTVSIDDFSRYCAEDSSSITRRLRLNPLHAHRTMYKHISRCVKLGLPADNIQSLRSSVVVAQLEKLSSLSR